MPKIEELMFFNGKRVSGLQELSMTWSLIYALNSNLCLSPKTSGRIFNRGLIVCCRMLQLKMVRIYRHVQFDGRKEYTLTHIPICKPNIWLACIRYLTLSLVPSELFLYRRHIEFGDFFTWNVHLTHCLLSWNYIMWNMHHNRNEHIGYSIQ